MGKGLTPLLRYFQRQKQLEDGTIFAGTSFTEQAGMMGETEAAFVAPFPPPPYAAEVDFECCGRPVVGAEYMGQQEMVCCGKPEPKGVTEDSPALPVFIADTMLRDAGLPTYTELAKALGNAPLTGMPEESLTVIRRMTFAGIIE